MKPTKTAKLLGIGYRALKNGDNRVAAKLFYMAMAQEDAPVTLEQLLPAIPEENVEFKIKPESSESPMIPSSESTDSPVEGEEFIPTDSTESTSTPESVPAAKETSPETPAKEDSTPDEILPVAQTAKIRAVANKIAASGHKDLAKRIFNTLDNMK